MWGIPSVVTADSGCKAEKKDPLVWPHTSWNVCHSGGGGFQLSFLLGKKKRRGEAGVRFRGVAPRSWNPDRVWNACELTSDHGELKISLRTHACICFKYHLLLWEEMLCRFMVKEKWMQLTFPSPFIMSFNPTATSLNNSLSLPMYSLWLVLLAITSPRKLFNSVGGWFASLCQQV